MQTKGEPRAIAGIEHNRLAVSVLLTRSGSGSVQEPNGERWDFERHDEVSEMFSSVAVRRPSNKRLGGLCRDWGAESAALKSQLRR